MSSSYRTIHELLHDAEYSEGQNQEFENETNVSNNDGRGRIQQTVGAGAFLTGSALVAYSYREKIRNLANLETLGVSLIAIGGAIVLPSWLGERARIRKERMEEKQTSRMKGYKISERDRLESMRFIETSLRASCFQFNLLNHKFSCDRDRLLDDLQVPLELVSAPESVRNKWMQSIKGRKEAANLKRSQRMKQLELESLEGDDQNIEASLNAKVFVVDFDDAPSRRVREQQFKRDGDMAAQETADVVQDFADTIDFIVQVATPHDEVVVRIRSPGGPVAEYGLAASHLLRLRKLGIPAVTCVDTIACSGGYMVAAASSKIVAAPFALVGSIGVVAEIPNFARVLDSTRLDYLVFTSGKHKRTIHPLVSPTNEARTQFQQELDSIHESFKGHVANGRKAISVDMNQVGTGQAWLASEAKDLGLVDELMTSEEYLHSKMKQYDVIHIQRKHQREAESIVRVLWNNLMGQVSNGAVATTSAFVSWVKMSWGDLAKDVGLRLSTFLPQASL